MTTVNSGYVNKATSDFDTTYVAADIAQTPDLWIIRWGLVDLSVGGRTYDQIATSLRSALAKIRVATPFSSGVSIVLMTPNSANSASIAAKDIEVLNRLIRRAALDYNCFFFDTYALTCTDSWDGGSLYIDSTLVNPTKLQNQLIIDRLVQCLFPPAATRQSCVSNPLYSQSDINVGAPVGAKFHLSGKSINADVSPYPSVPYALTGSCSVVADKILIPDNAQLCYCSGKRLDNGSIGCVRYFITPTWTGNPTAGVYFVTAGSTITPRNNLYVYQHTDGLIYVDVYDSSGGLIMTSNQGAYTFTSGTEYEIELNYDLTNGATRLFINGAQRGSTIAIISALRLPSDLITVGCATHPAFSIRQLSIFDAVQHTTTSYVTGVSSISIKNNTLQITSPIIATSTTTGAVVVSGGGGIATAGNVHAGGRINLYDNNALLRSTFSDVDLGMKAVSTWTIQSIPVSITWSSVCWSPELGLFAAVSSTAGATNRVMTSPDGVNWKERISASLLDWQSVCWSPGLKLFCAVARTGTPNNVMTSPDGITWTLSASANITQWTNVCWSPELALFCAVGVAGGTSPRIMTSSSGLAWTEAVSAQNSEWNSVCWSPKLKLFCALTYYTNTGLISSNGSVWTTITPTSRTNSICWSPELQMFCTVGPTGYYGMISYDGITWVNHSLINTVNWNSICWSPELHLFVAVSCVPAPNLYVIYTSSNGLTWTLARAHTNENGFRCICWSPELGIFCIVTSSAALVPKVYTSAKVLDQKSRQLISGIVNITGTTETVSSTTGSLLVSGGVATSKNLQVAGNIYSFGSNPVQRNAFTNKTLGGVAVSSWSSSSSGVFNRWQSICWSEELGIFCAVAESGIGNRVMTSLDGNTWAVQTNPDDYNWQSVCWSPHLSLFCAVASTGVANRVMTSPDGVNWTARASANTNAWVSVCWAPEINVFCAVSNSASTVAAMVSTNGSAWTQQTTPAELNPWSSVCWSAELGLFCAVASAGTSRVMLSHGSSWSAYSSISPIFAWLSVCWSAELGIFCAVGVNCIATSIDGIIWTNNTAPPAGYWNSVCWSPDLGVFVAVANSGTNVMTSSNGTSWQTTSGNACDWSSVCWSPGLGIFCAASNAPGAVFWIMYSQKVLDRKTRQLRSGIVDLISTTPSSSSLTGALVVTGGVAAAGNVYCGGFFSGSFDLMQTSTVTFTGASIITATVRFYTMGNIHFISLADIVLNTGTAPDILRTGDIVPVLMRPASRDILLPCNAVNVGEPSPARLAILTTGEIEIAKYLPATGTYGNFTSADVILRPMTLMWNAQ